MERNIETATVEETGLNLLEGHQMIAKLIDAQISNYKLQFINEWDADHQTSPDEINAKVTELEAIKANLRNLFQGFDPRETELSFSLSLEVKLEKKEQNSVIARELMCA